MSPETGHYETAKPLLPISSGMKGEVDTSAQKDLAHVEEG